MKHTFNTVMYAAVLALVLISTLPTQAQTVASYTIKGLVVDSANAQPEPYATIRLYQAGKHKHPIATGVADEQGVFSLTCTQAGRYTLEAAALSKGFCSRDFVLAEEKQVDLGRLALFISESDLKTAVVTAKAPLVKATGDRINYAVKDDPESKTQSLLDMLRKVPLVTVDGQDKITVNGSGSFKVYVNGQPNKLMSSNPGEIFKSYPASAVKSVEVITNPGAKYDAEGVSGILNIIMQTQDNTNGYTLTPGIRASQRGINESLFAMVKQGKLTLSGNLNLFQSKSIPTDLLIERKTISAPGYLLFHNEGTATQRSHGNMGSLEASYEFDAHNLLSVSSNWWGFRQNQDVTGETRLLKDGVTYLGGNHRSGTLKNGMDNIEIGVDYQHAFKHPQQKLTLSYHYSNGKTTADNFYWFHQVVNQAGLLDQLTKGTMKSPEHTGQIDFTTTLSASQTLSTGVKYIVRRNVSDFDELTRPSETSTPLTPDPSRSSHYRHNNNIGAAYGEWAYQRDALALRLGLRFETSRIEVKYPDGSKPSFSKTLNDLVPSVSASWNLSPTQIIKANYNLRINRPSIDALSPYVARNFPGMLSYGNPNLTSTRWHNFELGYNRFGRVLTLMASLKYTTTTNEMSNYSFFDGRLLNSTYGNRTHAKIGTFNLNVMWNATKTTRLNVNAALNYDDYKSYASGEHNHGYSGSVFANLTQDLWWKLKLGVVGGYFRGRYTLQGSQPTFHFNSLSLTRSFLKDDRLTVTLVGANLFFPQIKMTNRIGGKDFTNIQRFTMHKNMVFAVGATWRIGHLKAAVKKADHTISNQDVIKQKNNQGTQAVGM